MQIVQLHPKPDCHDIATALRNIADDIEAGAYRFAPDMAVVVLGRESERQWRDDISVGYDWQTHGLGKCGFFAAKGLLTVAAASFDSEALD